jgi:tetratricopeptide (TPR) repeat protein
MGRADGPPSPAARRPSRPAELRQLWDAGQHARAIRSALRDWQRVLAHDDELDWLQRALRDCGLEAGAFALQARRCRRRAEAREWEVLIASLLRIGDPWWARELLEEAGSGSRDLERLRIEAELAVGDASALISGWTRKYRDEAALEAAIGWYVELGRIAEAERLLEQAPGANLWRARFALWRKQPDVALRWLNGLPPSPEVRVCAAVAALQEGRVAQAESLLRALVDTDVRAEALTWLAAVLRRQRRYGDAALAAEAASFASPTFNLAARLERELAVEHERPASQEPETTATRPWWRRVRQALPGGQRTIAQLEHAALLYPLGLRPDDPIRSLEGLLDRFGGNRTLHLTTTEAGSLSPCRLPLDPRYLGANVLRVLWTRGPAAARALYRTLAPAVDDHPLFRIYAGELELWMGAYDEAERIFRDILARESKVLWGWIGLGASVMFQGRLREAHALWERGESIMGFRGPTAYVYRGECYRRQGDTASARRELESAVRQAPQRLSAWINLALVNGDREELERAVRECVAFAPMLMGVLTGTAAERLEKVLEAMRGNRRSSPDHVSYHLWGRVWRRHASYRSGMTGAGAPSASPAGAPATR